MQCPHCHITITENSDGSRTCQICGWGYNPRDVEDEFGNDEDFDDLGRFEELPDAPCQVISRNNPNSSLSKERLSSCRTSGI